MSLESEHYRRKKPVDNQTFIKNVRDLFPFSKIYYPGRGDDNQLERVLHHKEIVSLDDNSEPNAIPIIHPLSSHIKGNYANSPFIDEAFEAIFIQDIHVEEKPPEIKEIMRVLRNNGIIIYSTKDCSLPGRNNHGIASMSSTPYLNQVNLSFRHKYFTLFQKVVTP